MMLMARWQYKRRNDEEETIFGRNHDDTWARAGDTQLHKNYSNNAQSRAGGLHGRKLKPYHLFKPHT